ncbi:MAG: hypothetical protein K6F84_02285 [Lachnospiraceae bacterium]|nr:hypothetical protein [Lachnospiraceae bacterium]
MDRASIIRSLQNEFNKNSLPDIKEYDPNGSFDESTGTFYGLTGRRQIMNAEAENAIRYFKGALQELSMDKASTEDHIKAVYCSIAIEAISRTLESENSQN